MKKFCLMVVVMVGMFILVSCGGSNNTLTLTDKDGNTVDMTVNEVYDSYGENEAAFENLYMGHTVKYTGTVDNIDGESYRDGATMPTVEITFKEGMKLEVYAPDHQELINSLKKGDKLNVESDLQSVDKDWGISTFRLNISGASKIDESVIKMAE